MGWRYLNRRVEPAVISYIASVAVKLSPLMQTTSGHLIRARERMTMPTPGGGGFQPRLRRRIAEQVARTSADYTRDDPAYHNPPRS